MNTATERKTTGLYGGSFNPPHVAHVLTVGWALSVGDLNEVWVIPTGGHPFGKPLEDFDRRLEMCRLAFSCFGSRVTVLDVEREDRIHYSVETVEEIHRVNPDRDLRWVIGSDALAQSDQWRDFDRLRRLAPLLVIGRRGYRTDGAGASEGTRPADGDPAITLPNVSSSLLRELIARSGQDENSARDLEGLVPRNVIRYIRRHGLYGSE